MPQRYLGRALISLANLLTLFFAFRADWNDSHVFNQQWRPHARFHTVTGLSMTAILTGFAQWLLWRPSKNPDATVTTAALTPIAYWGPFFLAPLVEGTGIDDPEHRLARVGGVVPANLAGAGATVLTAAAGWGLDRLFGAMAGRGR